MLMSWIPKTIRVDSKLVNGRSLLSRKTEKKRYASLDWTILASLSTLNVNIQRFSETEIKNSIVFKAKLNFLKLSIKQDMN